MSSSALQVRRAGLVLIVAGLVAGAFVYASAGADADADALARQREMSQVERLGGTATVQAVKFDQWLGSLWHGRSLGVTLAVLGLVAGGLCRHVGALMDEDLDDYPSA
jgi:hypothetical protein